MQNPAGGHSNDYTANLADIAVHILAVLLSACGEGGEDRGEESATVNQPPTLQVGPDLLADEGTTVYLSGSADDPDGHIASYDWEQTGGLEVVLSGDTTAIASFTAPEVSTDQTLTFRLTVTDDKGATASGTVTVTVWQVESNQPPTLQVGPDLLADEGTTVYLSGSADDPDGHIASYDWEQTSGLGVVLSGDTTAIASFTAPEVSTDQTLTFRLTVTDDKGATASDTATVTVRQVKPKQVKPKRVKPKQPLPDLFVDEGTIAHLHLAGLANEPDGDIISYDWEQMDGLEVVLSGDTTAIASFTAPEVSTDETLTFRLTVTDSEGATASDTVTVTVRQVESATLKISVFGDGELDVVGTSDQLDCDAIILCEGIFDRGSDVVLEATPAADWVHERWVGCDQASGNQCTVSLDGDRLVSVTFLSEDPLEFDDDVIVLNDDDLERIIDYDTATGLLMVETNMPGVSNWVAGDILLSDGVDSDPERPLSFARRITLIESQPGRFDIHTEPVSLAELFRSGSLRGRGQIQEVTVPGIGTRNSVILSEEPDSAVVDINFELSDNVSVSGKLRFSLDPEPEIDFNADPLEVRVLLHARAEPSLVVSIGRHGTGFVGSSGVSWEKSFKLMELTRTLLWSVVMVKIRVPVFLTIKGAVNATGIEPEATSTVKISAGVHYLEGEGLERIFNVDTQPKVGLLRDRPLDELELSVEAGVRAEGEALFYGAVGPVIKFTPYLGMKTCAWTYLNFYTGSHLEIGGQLQLPGFNWLTDSDDVSIGVDIPVLNTGPTHRGTIRLRPGQGGGPVVSVRDLEIFDHDINSLSLRWSEPQHGCLEAVGYSVYRDGRLIRKMAANVIPGEEDNVETFVDTRLEPNTEYCYRVAAVLPTGEQAMPGNETCGKTEEADKFLLVSVGDGRYYVCGVHDTGAVACWGDNQYGQSTPPTGTFISVSAGDYYTCGVRDTGAVACWGDNYDGQSTPPTGTFVSVSAGYYHTGGVRDTGAVACWGNIVVIEPPTGTFISVSAGGFHTCGVRAGAVACWGDNLWGQITPPTGTFTSVSAGYYHTCGVRDTGAVACWGGFGGNYETALTGTFTSVSAGGYYTCGVRDTGAVACDLELRRGEPGSR